MCDPVSITAAALSIGSTLAGADAQKKQHDRNKKNASNALTIANRDISLRALQERLAAAQERIQLDAQAKEISGLTEVSAAGGGVGGMTIDMLLQDVENRRLGGQDAITQQLDATLGALDRERAGALVSSRREANQTSAPNPFAVGLRIAAGGVDAYSGYLARNPPVTPKR